jgi:hypothetical protein
VLVEDRRTDPLLIEHSRSDRWGLVVAAWRTWALTLTPARFWRRVRLEHRVVPRRLVLWALVVLLGTHVLTASVGTWLIADQAQYSERLLTRDDYVFAALRAWVAPLGDFVQNWRGGTMWGYVFTPAWRSTPLGPAYTPLLAAWLMYPIMMMVLVDTRHRAKVRPGHIARAGVFSLAWLVPFLLVRSAAGVAGYLTQNGPTWGPPAVDIPLAVDGALLLGTLLWQARWWACTARVGWRLDRPRQVWVAAFIAALLVAAILVALDRGVIWRVARM